MKGKVLYLLAALCAIAACKPENKPETGNNEVITIPEGGTVSKKYGSFGDYVGAGKYTLVMFWTIECQFCKPEMPYMTDVFKKYGDKGLVVIGVPVGEEADQVVKALQEMDVHFPQFLDPSHELVDKYDIGGYPQIILFGPDGTVVERGLRKESIEKAVKKVLE